MRSRDLNFEYYEDFVDYLTDKVVDNDESFLTVVGKFEEMREIFKRVMLYEDVNFENIDIKSPNVCEYKGEFYLSLWFDDGVLNVDCKPLKENDDYIHPCGDEVYLIDNISSKIIRLCETPDLYFVNVGNCDDGYKGCDSACACREGESCVEYSKGDDGDIHGFTASKSDNKGYYSVSYYTSDALNKDGVQSMLRDFGF